MIPNDIDGPPHNCRRVIVEPLEDFGVRASAVVLAHERQPALVHYLIDTLLRVTAVADNIPQAEGLVDLRTVTEHRLQRLPVGVDVRENRYLQTGFSYR